MKLVSARRQDRLMAAMATLAMLAGSANAQDDRTTTGTATGRSTATDRTSATGTAISTRATSTNSRATNTDSSKTDAKTTSASSQSKLVITASNTNNDGSTGTALPSYSRVQITAVNSNNDDSNTGLPTLTGNALPTLSSTGVPKPTVTVPSNANNPFMSQSNLPEGTVFIAVGAILGGIVAAVFVWHLMVAFMHKRNLKKFTSTNQVYTAPFMDENKGLYSDNAPSGGAGATTYGGHAYSGSVGAVRKSLLPNHEKPSTDARTRSMINSGLFFSPTAEVMNNASQANQANDSFTSTVGSTAGVGIAAGNRASVPRASVYMPAGYYGNQGGRAASMMSGGQSVRNMSMSNISFSGGAAPHQAPSISGSTRPNSTYMQQGGGGGQPEGRETVRAPSAYLDDFLGADK